MQSIQQIVTSTPQVANSATSVASALAKPRVAATPTPTTPTAAQAAASSSTITANDFLTLLVAEMKNQDPTQPTDPNEYITQMVDVNSLQQLIGINSGITSLDTAAGATPATPAVSSVGASAGSNAQAMAVIDAMPTGSSGAAESSGMAFGSSGTAVWGSGINS
jgi:flagellar basal-body rod modification protein FlgD